MPAKKAQSRETTFRSAFRAENDLAQYGSNALALFVLQLFLRIEDIHEFAADAITDGSNDKKIDICYLNIADGRAVIAQSYLSRTWGKPSAPANKASDLNTGIAWLLSASEDKIPSSIKSKALELRKSIAIGEITHLEISLIHNCHESKNVQSELSVTANAARDMVAAIVGQRKSSIVISHKEFGLESIEELYLSRDSEILIDGWISVPAGEYVRVRGKGWKAIMTSVPGDWIQELHKTYGDRLFSANYRDYLGAAGTRGNINREISKTVQEEPNNFWVYNNGITTLTHEIKTNAGRIKIRGLSVINGAQTSGALSESPETATPKTKVPIRFVECADQDLINKIVKYNNTQNDLKPADSRSKDDTQTRLHQEFNKYGIHYVHRRTSLRTSRNAITASGIAPALCAFHGDPQTAYRNSKEIFLNDKIYNQVFPPTITAEHIFLIRSLSVAYDTTKLELKNKDSIKSATQLEQQQYKVLKYSASKHFIFYAAGELAEEIMGQRVSDLFGWKCNVNLVDSNNSSLHNAWKTVLEVLLPQLVSLIEPMGEDAYYEVPRSLDQTREVVMKLKSLIASLRRSFSTQLGELRRRTNV